MRVKMFLAVLLLALVTACSEQKTMFPENFANPGVNTPPTGWLDDAAYSDGKFKAWGWAADNEDGSPVTRVALYVDNKLVGYAKLGIERPDVAKTMQRPDWAKAGWQIEAQIQLPSGSHKASAVAYDKMSAFTILSCVKPGQFEKEFLGK
ncbi:MAG: hypothetical protein HQL08_14090 [Nitrospirae bacterium]|nr:hypothetical protein [Nitrospirota bacterium]